MFFLQTFNVHLLQMPNTFDGSIKHRSLIGVLTVKFVLETGVLMVPLNIGVR